MRHTVTRTSRKQFPTHFFALWHDIGKYDADKASFKSYIYGIARNCANNKARHIRKQAKTVPIDMKPPQGKVFIYKYINGMSIKEISGVLCIKEKDVQNILYRGKKKLKKLFEERGIL